jgi:predicted ATPase
MKSISKFSSIPESKFVGRERELAELKGHLEDSISGQGRLVFVLGEAGIGKSRLISELVEYVESEDIVTLYGRCLYDENTEPYLPFIDAFGEYISGRKRKDESYSSDDPQTTEDFYSMGLVGIAESSPIASDPLPSSDATGDLIPIGLLPIGVEDFGVHPSKVKEINLQQERTRLFESLSQLVNDISEDKPLLVILEDLQWADDGSLQLLHYLARNIQNCLRTIR